MINKINKFNFYLLLVIIGSILIILNSKNLFQFYGILPISVIFFSLPVIINIFSEKNNNLSNVQYLILIFLPLIIINYIYFIKIGHLVGFLDINYNLYEYNNLFYNDKIIFSHIQGISQNFVGMFVYYKFLELFSGFDILLLATIIPPIFNIVNILLVYLIANKIYSNKIAVISTLIFGWTNNVLLFGHEFRTQIIATIFMYSILLIMIIFYFQSKLQKNFTLLAFIIFSIALVITSFIANVYALIIFISFLITSLIFFKKKKEILPIYLIILYVIILFLYVSYIGFSFGSIFLVMSELIAAAFFAGSFVNSIGSPNVGQEIYGTFIKWFIYLFWVLFIVGMLYKLKQILWRQINIVEASFIFSFSALLIFGFVSSIYGQLNPGRIYIITMILMSTIVTYLFFKILSISKKEKNKNLIKIIISIFLILYISTSMAQLPNYVIGNTIPIRNHEPIDDNSLWYYDNIDHSTSGFIATQKFNKTLYYSSTLDQYFYINLFDQIVRINMLNPSLKNDSFINNDLFIARYNKTSDINKNNFLESIDYYKINVIYINGGYFLLNMNITK